MSTVELCAVEDLPDGQIREVEVDSWRLAALRVGGDVYVFPPTCPHRAGPLHKGKLEFPVTAEAPGAVEVARDVPTVCCPWHGWQFRLDNGCAIGAEETRIRLLPASVVDGRVVVEV